MKNKLLTDRAALFLGDAARVDAVLAPNSIDAIVTDPPAGIGFMGREWDSDKGGRDAWVTWLADVMRKALYVLKPGGHALVWALPRTSHWTATALEDAGFEIRDVVLHLFGTGFPKSLDVSQAIDKQKRNMDEVRLVTRWIAEMRDLAGLTNARIDAAFGHNGMAGHWTTQGAQPEVPHAAHWPKLLELLGIDELPETIREITERLVAEKGKPGPNWFRRAITGHHEMASPVQRWIARHGHRANLSNGARRDEPATDAAREWAGWGTALKPAVEHWILCRKPLMGTVAANVQQWRTGGLNVAACRIPHASPEDLSASKARNPGRAEPVTSAVYGASRPQQRIDESGRWPANVTLDEAAAELLDAQAPGSGASRFFYVAKPTRTERDEGCTHLPFRSGAGACGRKEGSAGMNSPRAGATSGGGHNHHPTVKSIALMRWLCRLITPPGGAVLDLFAGSGSTGVAALAEGFEFVGIERDSDYVEIANARLRHELGPEAETAQTNMG
ncbi:DNA methyltransferase [Myxococcus llanfairpwllgwyngyllgogerychwyrndrobwllllantysiliogogogochensis]|uniref:DNA methyltransferase n=1 Tax=Myxococcus llanfairpwllgwyngyllgogerychwyrndrobwllllantysiliogogogochensis TaxID=2590453 RepID=UPI001FE7E428|nr:DNA methyltransferase [Myxococcus llanfairpwllgwyngyllgogerychwyrndrobwllllantysiliogogogochensis]